jgi:hypothetical protein
MSECPICFKKANYTTVCDHKFCKKCLYYWKSSCPLCRKSIQLEYPNTRAGDLRAHVTHSALILLNNIRMAEKKIHKLQFAEKLFDLVWDNRIIIRRSGHLCKIIQRKSLECEVQFGLLKIKCPEVVKKTQKI